MKKKTAKYVVYGVVALLVLVLIVRYMLRPTYPDILKEKPILGNENASILIEEFSDFQCPACGAAEPVVKSILAEFDGKVKYKYLHFPLTGIHQYAFKAAEASECANDQDKFWEYHDALFRNQRDLSKSNLKRIASELNLNMKNFTACFDLGTKRIIVESEQREGFKRGVRGTPTFFINGKMLESWRYDIFKAAIEQELNAKS